MSGQRDLFDDVKLSEKQLDYLLQRVTAAARKRIGNLPKRDRLGGREVLQVARYILLTETRATD